MVFWLWKNCASFWRTNWCLSGCCLVPFTMILFRIPVPCLSFLTLGIPWLVTVGHSANVQLAWAYGTVKFQMVLWYLATWLRYFWCLHTVLYSSAVRSSKDYILYLSIEYRRQSSEGYPTKVDWSAEMRVIENKKATETHELDRFMPSVWCNTLLLCSVGLYWLSYDIACFKGVPAHLI